MKTETIPIREQPTKRDPVFPSVLCGIDGSPASLEAARQAAELLPLSTIRLLAVTWEQGRGANAVAILSRRRAEEYLDRARAVLREAGVEPVGACVDDADASRRLLDEALRHDLLVVGVHTHSRAAGIMLGSTASAALHRGGTPVLVARHPRDGDALLDRVLVALDGSASSRGAADAAARLVRGRATEVTLIAPRSLDRPRRHVLAECTAMLRDATGTEPVVVDADGSAHRAIVAAAQDVAATLVVIGSRGLSGVAALRSVSERVAHEAPCSVLVMRGAAPGS